MNIGCVSNTITMATFLRVFLKLTASLIDKKYYYARRMKEPSLNGSKNLQFLTIFKCISLDILQNVVRSLLSAGGPHTLLSLKYYAPDTRSNFNICHIILSPVPYSISYIRCNASEPSCVSLSVKWYICLSGDSNTLSHDPAALSWTKHVDQPSASGLFDDIDQYNEHIPCVVVVCSGLTSLTIIFSHITTVSGCDRKLNAHFYCVAPDT